MKEKLIVYELDEKDLEEILGGKDLPYIGPKICAKCGNNNASKRGFVVKNKQGSILKVHFSKPLCDSCAQLEVSLYKGWDFVTWL